MVLRESRVKGWVEANPVLKSSPDLQHALIYVNSNCDDGTRDRGRIEWIHDGSTNALVLGAPPAGDKSSRRDSP
jgi:hypothetical protein